MIRRHLTSERGFTLIEVMVAALVLVIGMTALAGVLIGASNQATADVRQSQLINVADQQIELVRSDVQTNGFSALAMNAVPGVTTLPSGVGSTRLTTFTDPGRWVTQGVAGATSSAACFQIQGNYDSGTASLPPVGFNPWSNCQSTGAEPLAIPTQTLSGTIVSVNAQGSGAWVAGTWPPPACPAAPAVASPCTVTLSSTVRVAVYTFVTYTYSACSAANTSSIAQASCPTLTNGTVSSCGSTTSPFPTAVSASTPCGDSRRVTVAVVPVETHALARQTPVYISTLFTNPNPSTSGAPQLGLHVQVTL
jgi:prepilin-type N-terminal cleavage/methylation domain-containing protein